MRIMTETRREPECVKQYLDMNADRGPGRGLAAAWYLTRYLRANFPIHVHRHHLECEEKLPDDLERRVEAGELVRLPSARGGAAYHRVGDLPWPLTFPLKPWLRAQQEAAVPLEIDCRHHLRRCEIGAVSGRDVLRACAVSGAFYETLDGRAVTLECPHGPGDPAAPLLASLFLEAARALAEGPDEPVAVSAAPIARAIGLAAALMHAQDCLHAQAIMRAVDAEALSRVVMGEIERTGRVAYALRSAADPAWVAARALETLK
jgi:hypothetical protein